MNTPETTPPAPAPNSLSAWLAQNAFTLVILALVLALMYRAGVDFLVVGKVVVGLGLVIFIHELGHFVAAKWCDVHVETFSIGFGPPLPGCQFRYGETTYMLALFPLGGYVKMVGEGSDDDDADDPRSFKNKTVGQRMLIISAGVVMNVILAAVCFVGIYRTSGVERPAGVIGTVDAGSPSWQKGLRSGVELVKIGETEHPYFDDVMPEVMHWPSGQPIPVVYRTFEGQPRNVSTELVPRKNETTGRPMIGIAPARATVLRPANRLGRPPYQTNSAASRAEPAFQNGDRIVGTTDPDQPADDYQPERTKPLPPDSRDPHSGRYDFFELVRRFQRLADRPLVVLVERSAGEKHAAEPLAVTVPPAYHTNYGLRMMMGQIVAVRQGSPAEQAKVQARDASREIGDILTGVEVKPDKNSVVRFVPAPSPNPAPGVVEKVLDPVRLPYDLEHWFAQHPGASRKVKLTLVRQIGHNERKEVTAEPTWDDGWRDELSAPSSLSSPLAVNGLGLAYTVMTVIDDVAKDSPAANAGLQKGDVVKAIQFYDLRNGQPDPVRWLDLEPDQWARPYWVAQEESDLKTIGLRVQREVGGTKQTLEVVLDGVDDKDWPLADRGLSFETDTRMQKADTLGQALVMGGRRTGRLITQIYQNLSAMVDGRISFKKNASGPLSIAAVSYDIAGESLSLFILFLGMISVNLAVINFLPIPVLDGGHMVFLIYEKLRGRPAPEQVRIAATFVGLAMIGSLMLFVIYLDVRRLWF